MTLSSTTSDHLQAGIPQEVTERNKMKGTEQLMEALPEKGIARSSARANRNHLFFSIPAVQGVG